MDNDNTPNTDGSKSGSVRRKILNTASKQSPINERPSNRGGSPKKVTRRGVLRGAAGASAAALAMGAGLGGTASAQQVVGPIDEFEQITIDSQNRMVDESGNPFKMRGVSIPDPRRLDRTKQLRGKTPEQIVNMITNWDEGWAPRAIRVPAQPQDIGEHPMGHAGPDYFDENGNLRPEAPDIENPDALDETRRAMQPPQPVAFTRNQLESYLDNYYDPIVEQCKERGVYCIVDFHRHWHEQPPGEAEPSGAENHLPYDSPYTNYWAYNTFEGDNVSFDETTPGSWGYVDQTYINEGSHSGQPGVWAGIQSRADIPGTPYEFDAWQVNEELLEEALLFWEVVADRYADEPHVIFEPYNEPTAPGIWGPVEGCGAIKQEPLWETFVDEFMGPILDEIRQHQPERALLVGVPGWCQSLQGLYWYDFNDAGYDNIAVTWHNYAGHDVSQINNWFNNTNYNHYGVYEDPANDIELTDPYLEPPEELSEGETPDCWGWEGYEAAGLQEAYEFHHISVSEFGWINDEEVSHWLRGTTTGQGTTPLYGVPFFDAVEDEDRMSWIAWCADVRWYPTMFEFPDGPDEGELTDDVLVNDNFYDTDLEDIWAALGGAPCPDVEDEPCEWELLGGEDSGEYIKEQIWSNRGDLVPLQQREFGPTGGDCEDGVEVGDYCAGDTTGDGLYEDVNGDGTASQQDVAAFFENLESDAVQGNPDAFNFDGEGGVGFSDIVALFQRV